MGGTFEDGDVRMRFRDFPLFDLTQQLSSALAAYVIDRTGLTGKYDFRLEFALPEEATEVGIRMKMGQASPLSRLLPSSSAASILQPVSGRIRRVSMVRLAMHPDNRNRFVLACPLDVLQ